MIQGAENMEQSTFAYSRFADHRQTFAFDPRAVDWIDYINEIHLPSVREHARPGMVPICPIKSFAA